MPFELCFLSVLNIRRACKDFYTGEPIQNYPTIDRIDNSKGYTTSNVLSGTPVVP